MERKQKIMCLHGYRTSGAILKKQIQKWPNSILHRFDFHFPDAPFPSSGDSGLEGIYDPPYFEWFQFNMEAIGDVSLEEAISNVNLEECLQFIENYMLNHGPFDGILGFSQGAFITAALPGLQEKGIALTKVPKIKFVIIISGSKFRPQSLLGQQAYSPSIACPSLHFLSEEDFLKPYGLELLKSFTEPLVIDHPKGHTVPTLDEQSLKVVESFIHRISKM